MIDFPTITGFTIASRFVGLLSLSIVSLPLNNQKKGTLALDIVSKSMGWKKIITFL